MRGITSAFLRPRRLLGTLAAMSLVGGAAASGVPADQQPPGSFSEEVSVAYVLVPVVVEGPHGPLEDLEPQDFELLVDGRDIPIESFESGDAPVTLFFLQDLSGSMDLVGRLQSSKQVLNHFLERATPGDRFAMFTFAGNQVRQAVPLTAEVDRLRRAAWSWHPYGKTALHDAVALLPDLVVDSPSSRRAVLLVSDGLDNASAIDPVEARRRIRASEIPVYVIGLQTGSPYDLTAGGEKIYRYADVLNLLASLTGGSYHSVSDSQELEAACSSILDELRHQYILGFSTAGRGEPAARTIEVRVRKRDAEVSHRESYRGQPPRSLGS